MKRRHGVSSKEADEALADPLSVTFDPDPSSLSGASVRVSGRSATTGRLLTVIIRIHEGVTYGVNDWPANSIDQRRHKTGGDMP
ncbi:transposase [Gulosibacter molinativorax]|uniref:Transposase n=1 Tax=Gulosibacter molinativorax TaxID=256821 RepID=A0ABT7CB98_9MICO|nr:transposase [Gulosibacter molinativorax]